MADEIDRCPRCNSAERDRAFWLDGAGCTYPVGSWDPWHQFPDVQTGRVSGPRGDQTNER